MKSLLLLLLVVCFVWAGSSTSLKKGETYYTLVRLNVRSAPNLDAEKITVLPVLEKVTFTGRRSGELTATLFGKEVNDSFVEIVFGQGTGWVFGPMIGNYWDDNRPIMRYLTQLVSEGDSQDKTLKSLTSEGLLERDSEYYESTLEEYECDALWSWMFNHQELIYIRFIDGSVSDVIINLTYGSRTPRTYRVDLTTYLNSPDLDEVCSTTVDVGGYEVPDGCYLVGLNE